MTPPKAVRYTTVEGGYWHPWIDYETGLPMQDHNDNPFAIEFENGWIWDRMVGWRKPHNVDCPPAQTPVPMRTLPDDWGALRGQGLPPMQEQRRRIDAGYQRVDGGYWAC